MSMIGLRGSGGCPFCGLCPYEYVDVGVGSVPVAVNCCEFGPFMFDWRTKKADMETAARIAEQIQDMPHGEARFQRATDLFYEAFPEWSAA